jgi:hypothetical protein
MAGRVVMFLGLISLISCKGTPSVQTNTSIGELLVTDSTLIFDGRTLDGWEITNFGPQGPVTVSKGELVLGFGDGCTGVTYTRKVPEINYEISLEARRKEGNDFFCGLTFPVGKDFCTFIAGGWGGTTTGLSCIDGKDAAENETTTLYNFEKNRWYRIKVVVMNSKIEAWIDNDKVVNLGITGKKLSVRPEVTLSRPLGIASWNTTAGVRKIRLKSLQVKNSL